MCDCLVALGPATADGNTLFAKNSDRPPTETQVLEWFEPRRESRHHDDVPRHRAPRRATRSGSSGRVRPGCGGSSTVSTRPASPRGTPRSSRRSIPTARPTGLTGMDLVRLGLERAATASAAVEVITDLLERHGQGGSGHEDGDRPYWSSFLVADSSSAFVIETSGRRAFDRGSRPRAGDVQPNDDPGVRPGASASRGNQSTSSSIHALPRATTCSAGSRSRSTRWLRICDRTSAVTTVTPCACTCRTSRAPRTSIVAELPVGGPPRVWTVQDSPCTHEFVRSW